MQINFDKFIDANSPLSKLPLWPSITFFVIFLGFIGFYTYCGLNVTPFAIPDIKVVLGIGLYNLFFILTLFVSHQSMYSDKSIKALLILSLFQFILNEPKSIAYSTLFVVLFYTRGYWENQFGLKLKTKEEEDPSMLSSASLFFETLGWILASVLAYFKGILYFGQFLTIYVLLHETNKILTDKSIRYISFLIILIIVPIFTTYSFLSKRAFNLVGLYYSDVKIKYKTGTSNQGVIVLKTGSEIYFKDSINSNSTKIINTGDIESISILVPTEKLKDNETPNSDTLRQVTIEDSLINEGTLNLRKDSITNKHLK